MSHAEAVNKREVEDAVLGDGREDLRRADERGERAREGGGVDPAEYEVLLPELHVRHDEHVRLQPVAGAHGIVKDVRGSESNCEQDSRTM